MSQQPAEARSLFPPPPPFYRLYTDDSKEKQQDNPEEWWTPPPPFPETFQKFGVVQSAEPAEIEKCLLECEQVSQVAVKLDNQALVSFFVPKEKDEPNVSQKLLDHFQKKLPSYMGTHIMEPVPILYNFTPVPSAPSSATTSATSSSSSLPPTNATTTRAGSQMIDFIPELRRLNRLAADRYVDFLRCLLDCTPSEVEAKVKEINHIFLNSTHLLNLMRPHQARQTVAAVLQKQIQQRIDKAEHLENCAKEAKQFLAAHGVTYDIDGSVIPPAKPPSLPSFGVHLNAADSPRNAWTSKKERALLSSQQEWAMKKSMLDRL